MEIKNTIRTSAWMSSLTAFMLSPLFVSAVQAELELPKPSPRAEVSQRVGVTDIELEYSSPAVRGRTIWGELVPYDEMWRTGANACTEIEVSTDVTFAGERVKEGEYCLFTVPGKKTWQVILNSNTDLWGANNYSKDDEVLRVELTPVTLEKSERMQFRFKDFDDSSATLVFHWDTLGLEIPIAIETEKLALANIESLEEGSWKEYADAAEYLNKQGQQAKAMEYIEKSIAKSETWYNTWLKASLLAEQGDNAQALSLAKKSKSMGDDSDFFAFYAPSIDEAIAKWQ